MSTTVAACQLAVSDLDVRANLDAIGERVAGLPEAVEIAVFPEYAITGFDAEGPYREAALRRDGPDIDELRDLAATHDLALVAGFLEDAGDVFYNATVYLSPDGEATVYRKRHRWDRERDHVAVGDDLVTVETPAGEAGLLTCYDLNFVDDSAALAREEVRLLLVPGAWPAAYSENWRLLLRARALDGVRWVVGANRTGSAERDAHEAQYAGRSMVARPDGGVHAALDGHEDDLVCELDPDVFERQRELVGVFEG